MAGRLTGFAHHHVGLARRNRRAWARLVKELQASTKAFPDGGVILSKELEIIRCNKAARQMLGSVKDLAKQKPRGVTADAKEISQFMGGRNAKHLSEERATNLPPMSMK